jgi:antitoxin MazE
VRIELIRIGNSRGVRIPKSIIDQCGFGDSVELLVEDGRAILARDPKPRDGWKEALAAARESIAGDELLLDGIPEDEFDRNEWTW